MSDRQWSVFPVKWRAQVMRNATSPRSFEAGSQIASSLRAPVSRRMVRSTNSFGGPASVCAQEHPSLSIFGLPRGACFSSSSPRLDLRADSRGEPGALADRARVPAQTDLAHLSVYGFAESVRRCFIGPLKPSCSSRSTLPRARSTSFLRLDIASATCFNNSLLFSCSPARQSVRRTSRFANDQTGRRWDGPFRGGQPATLFVAALGSFATDATQSGCGARVVLRARAGELLACPGRRVVVGLLYVQRTVELALRCMSCSGLVSKNLIYFLSNLPLIGSGIPRADWWGCRLPWSVFSSWLVKGAFSASAGPQTGWSAVSLVTDRSLRKWE